MSKVFFLFLSCLWIITGVYGAYKCRSNDYLIPHLMFEPNDKQWRRKMTAMVYTIVIVLMALLFLSARLNNHLPVTVNAIAWIVDIVLAVYLLDLWSHCTAVSVKRGKAFVNTKQGRAKKHRKSTRHLHLN